MSSAKVWLVTGASSGFGRATTEALLMNGDKVVATLRTPDAIADLQSSYPTDQLLVVKLDVTKPDEIEAAFAKGKAAFGRIDVVFNNAGFAVFGEIEGTPDDKARALFEVLFFGAANVSKTAVKYFRENSPIGGHLIQNSSNVSWQAYPGVGYYCATKGALESFTDALAREIDPAWKIKITLVEPGPFRTKVVGENAIMLPPHPAYINDALPTILARKFIGMRGLYGDTKKAALAFMKIAALEDPPFHFPIHKNAIADARAKAKILNEAADKWESWSEDIYH